MVQLLHNFLVRGLGVICSIIWEEYCCDGECYANGCDPEVSCWVGVFVGVVEDVGVSVEVLWVVNICNDGVWLGES